MLDRPQWVLADPTVHYGNQKKKSTGSSPLISKDNKMTYEYRIGDPPKGAWIPKENLEADAWYEGKCRNASYARWDGIRFHYLRHKFGEKFWEEIECPEDDRGFDVFFAFRKLDGKPEDL